MSQPIKRRARLNAVLDRLCKDITPAQRELFGKYWNARIDSTPPPFALSYGIYTQTRYGYKSSGKLV